ncbi:hypothetical protein V1288_006306 [Bradyrhizobium sp. AZCC 2176]
MLKLVIGNKNYSSWSMRPWLALRANDIPFEEVFIPLYTDDKADKDRILSFSDSGKVPALIDGDVTVWDSLSIIEYLAEKFPQSRLWPDERARRAHARSISAEMHSGFMPLRNECGMNLHRPVGAIDLSDDARANCGAHPGDLGRLPPPLRQGRTVPVRRLRRRGRDVCACGAPLSHLCDRGERRGAALFRCHDVVAGIPGMDPRRSCRNARHRTVRDSLISGAGARAGRHGSPQRRRC